MTSFTRNKTDDATSLIGTFLLQGWVMTDKLCSEPTCSVPMMRSKDGMIQFCVVHDPLPTSNARNSTTTNNNNNSSSATISATTTTTTTISDDTEDDDSIVVIDSTKHQTAATHDDDDEFRIKQERREQSSKASQLIGQKLLQRWALLNDTCPNTTCYAIPLVRHPSNKSMYCVICEQSYLPEAAAAAVQQTTTNSHSQSSSMDAAGSKQEQSTESSSPTTTINMIHSPLDSPVLDRSTKRQKKQEKEIDTTDSMVPTTTSTTTSTISARAATEISVQCLSRKLLVLNDRLDQCNDPKELVLLCQSMEACVKALGTCTTTLDTLN